MGSCDRGFRIGCVKGISVGFFLGSDDGEGWGSFKLARLLERAYVTPLLFGGEYTIPRFLRERIRSVLRLFLWFTPIFPPPKTRF